MLLALILFFVFSCILSGFIGYLLGGMRKEEDYTKRDDLCPHGYMNWDECPDCCH